MKFLCYFTWQPDTDQQAEAIRRFRESGGNTPAGCKLLGRWVRADFMGGVALMESSSAAAMTQWSLMWSDLMELEIVPVVDDGELVGALSAAGK